MIRLAILDDMLRAFLRHVTLLAFVVFVGVIASLVFALSLPRTYETMAVIQIEQPDIETASSTATANGQILQQLQIIEQRVMARENLQALDDTKQENHCFARGGDGVTDHGSGPGLAS